MKNQNIPKEQYPIVKDKFAGLAFEEVTLKAMGISNIPDLCVYQITQDYMQTYDAHKAVWTFIDSPTTYRFTLTFNGNGFGREIQKYIHNDEINKYCCISIRAKRTDVIQVLLHGQYINWVCWGPIVNVRIVQNPSGLCSSIIIDVRENDINIG